MSQKSKAPASFWEKMSGKVKLRRSHRKAASRVLVSMLSLSMLFGSVTTAFAMDEVPQEPAAVESMMEEPVEMPAEATPEVSSYTVRWYDADENELAYEVREGSVGQSVNVEPGDLLAIPDYVFINDDERNVQVGTVTADGALELKLYFAETAVPEEGEPSEEELPETEDVPSVEEPTEDIPAEEPVVDDVVDPEVVEPEVPEENVVAPEVNTTIPGETEEEPIVSESDTEVSYTVEWRNAWNQLIQSELRYGEAGSEVSVTEEDKTFDDTGRYWFNEEAEKNVLSGTLTIGEELVLVLFFDDAQSVIPLAVTNEFHFVLDMRPYGGRLIDTVRTDIYPDPTPGPYGSVYPGYMSLYDKFNWAYVEDNFDFVFSYYWSDLGDSPAGATTRYYGTFWSANKTDRLNAGWWFGYPKDDAGVRRVKWMPAFESNSVVPKRGVQVDVEILGDDSHYSKGDVFALDVDSSDIFLLSDCISSNSKSLLSNKLFDYTFDHYEVVSGLGDFVGDFSDFSCSFDSESMCVVKAVYNSVAKNAVQVNVEFVGDYKVLLNGDFTLFDKSSELSDFYNKSVFDCLSDSRYDFTLSSVSVVSGICDLSDTLSEDCVVDGVEGHAVIKVVFNSLSHCNFRVDTQIDLYESEGYSDFITTSYFEGSLVSCEGDGRSYHLADYLTDEVSIYLASHCRSIRKLRFDGFEVISGSGEIVNQTAVGEFSIYNSESGADFSDITDCYCPIDGESAIIVLKFSVVSFRYSVYYGDSFFINDFMLYGDVPVVNGSYVNKYRTVNSSSSVTLYNYRNSELVDKFKSLSVASKYADNYIWELISNTVVSYGNVSLVDGGLGSIVYFDVDKINYSGSYNGYSKAYYGYDYTRDSLCFNPTSSSSDYSSRASFMHTIRKYRLTAISDFRVDTRVYGDVERLYTGKTIHYAAGGYPTYHLSDYVNDVCLRGYDSDYKYVFKGYELRAGDGQFVADDVNSDYVVTAGDNVVVAMFEAVKSNDYARVDVKLHMSGLVNRDVDLTSVVLPVTDLLDLNDYLIDLDIQHYLPYFDEMLYLFSGYSVFLGDGVLSGSLYSNMSGGSQSVLYINYEVVESLSDDIMYLIFEDGYGNKIFDALPTTTGSVTLPVGYYMDGHGVFFSHKAWKDKITGEDISLPAIQSAKTISITKTITVVPRLEYYIDNLKIVNGLKISYENGLFDVIDDAVSDMIVSHESAVGKRTVSLFDLSLAMYLPSSDFYKYVFGEYIVGDSFVVDSGNLLSYSDLDSLRDAQLMWDVTKLNTTNSVLSHINIMQVYNAICFANEFQLNTKVIGLQDVMVEGDVEYALLSDAVNLKKYVSQDALLSDAYAYEFKYYEIVSGSGNLTASRDENGMLYVGNRNDGVCVVNAIYEAIEKPCLTYDTKGGSDVPNTYAENGQFMVTRRVPTKEDYVFKGWSKSADALDVDYIGGDYLAGTTSRTLYAVWAEDDGSVVPGPGDGSGSGTTTPTAKTYTLTYDTKTDVSIDAQKSNTGSFTVTRRTPVKSGYVFAGWSLSEDPKDASEVDYFSGDVFPATKNVTLYAVYVPKKTADSYSVTYDTKGGSKVDATVADNGMFMVTRRTPVKTGYVFAGWSLDSEAKDIDYIAGDKISAISNVTLYAVWVKEQVAQKYVLSYDTQGGSEVADTESIDGKFMVTRRTPKKDGKVFLGWSFYPNDDDIDFIAGDFVLADKNVILYAVYTDAVDAPVVETYMITYDTRGGSVVASTSSYNGIFTVTRRVPEKEGLVFAGWTTDANSENPADVDYAGGDTFPAERDITLYALYKTADVIVNVNGGSDVETNVTIVNNKYIIQITIPEKPGYDFPGWDTDGDGIPDVDPEEPIETEDPEIPIDAVWTLKVTPAQYVTVSESSWLSGVTWDSTNVELDSDVFCLDDALIDEDGRAMLVIPETVPIRVNHVFKGWDLGQPTLALGDEVKLYQAGDKVYLDEIDSIYEMGLRFTAVWEPIESGNPDDKNPVNPEKPDDKDPTKPGGDDSKPTEPGDKDPTKPDDGNKPGDGEKPDDTNKPNGDGNQSGEDNLPGGPKPPVGPGNGQPVLTPNGTGGNTILTNHYSATNSGNKMVFTGKGRRSSGSGSGSKSKIPQTGDRSEAVMWSLAMLFAAIAVAGCLRKRRSLV